MVVGAQINKVLADLTNTTDGLAKATDGLATMTATLVENMREHFDLAHAHVRVHTQVTGGPLTGRWCSSRAKEARACIAAAPGRRGGAHAHRVRKGI